MDFTAKILKIDNSNPDRVDFWVSMNADQTETFVTSIPALEGNKTVGELAEWAYHEWVKRQTPQEG
jgi:hypothetical protein